MSATTVSRAPGSPAERISVAIVSLGCARNEVDSEELAGRLADGGFDLVEDPAAADTVLVNTCTFIESAKKDSVDTVLAAADTAGTARTGSVTASGGARPDATVVAVGCMAERYGTELAEALPEAAAVLGFDAYPDIADRLRRIVAGDRPASHVPRDRRALLPLSPAARGAAAAGTSIPGHGAVSGDGAAPAPGATVSVGADLPAGLAPASGPRPVRRRLTGGPLASVKLASGCDRRCAFCAIPAFRGSFVSRGAEELLAEAAWLAGDGVRELFLVSENTTSYGKDLGDLRSLERLLPRLAAIEGIGRVRASYLQPAELRPGLVDALCDTPGVAPYFDLSFQHASGPLLRRMRRFGDRGSFGDLLAGIRRRRPDAGVRSNVIVGFPGETEHDLAELTAFLSEARLDAVGVFGYSDEEGTEAASLPGHLSQAEVDDRVAQVSALVDELVAQRAEERLGETVRVLVERVEGDGTAEGRADHQGPEVDGVTTLRADGSELAVGMFVDAVVTDTDGVDLVAEPVRDGGRSGQRRRLAAPVRG